MLYSEIIKRYFFWAIIAILIILSFLIIKPFIISLASAFILAYLIKPIFNILSKDLGKKLSAIICIILLILIIILPIWALTLTVISQAQQSLNTQFITSSLKTLSSYPIINTLNIDLSSLTKKGIEIIISLIKITASAIPSIIISIIIALTAIYYILINWDYLTSKLKQYLPFKEKERIGKEIGQITNALVYGTILIGIIEFIIAAISFYILGIKHYLLFSIIIFFFAFIPALGPAALSIPLAIYYLITKDYAVFIGIIIITIILSLFIDTFLKAKLIGKKTKINPLLMFIGILGGVPLFGIFGFIIGPLILIYTIELIEEIIKAKT